MKKYVSLITLVLISVLLATGFGCSSASSGLKPVVIIEYVGVFEGETSSGYLNLAVDLSIENRGYESFDTSPSNFSVKVGEYSYTARESRLEILELPDGAETQSQLIFQVPPLAATPGTGYSMAFSGGTAYNIEWIKSTKEKGDFKTEVADPVVNIAYFTDLMWVSKTPEGVYYLEVDPQGNLYLVVEMTIENKGYESFNINPDYFSVEVSSPIRTVTANVQGELIDWRELNIQNNGKYTGSLLFKIPTEVAQSFYRWEYKMMYSGVRSYDIRWTRINIARCTLVPTQTELEAIYLRDGDNITGKLAYFISPDLASDSASYELLYDYDRNDSSRNIQFFDQPNAVADINRNTIAYPVMKVTYSTQVTRLGEFGRLYLIVDVLIENKGYDRFYVTPSDFFVEVSY